MSVFLAIDLDDAAREVATALIETHRGKVEAKWLRPDKLHLTLVFLGNATADQLATFVPKIDALAERRPAFSLRLSGAGTFTTARAPSVLWLGVSGELDALAALQHDALGALTQHDDRPWVPHVTLARAKQSFDALAQSLADLRSEAFGVRHLTLYESTHHHYRVLHRAPFTPARAT